MKFTKMHGCGNDYVYVDCTSYMMENIPETAIQVSDRHFGIGSDGLILIRPSETADFFMDMYNNDGSRGKMCGNGIRCVAKYVFDHGLTDKKQLKIETLSGIKELDLTVEDGKVTFVKVNMGSPITKPSLIPVIFDKEIMIKEPIVVGDKRVKENYFHSEESVLRMNASTHSQNFEANYEVTCVSMGNPHAVVFVEDPHKIPIETLGPLFEFHEIFPERVNTEFVSVTDRNHIKMRVWERGSGETLACGTGACASVVACILNGLTDNEVTVSLLGGELVIKYDEVNNTVFMTGPAVEVFSGEINL
ncbi:MAG: diaminopimelate epimerase [Herbinix sp.]|nr:diaminopimelate epimerase [Herbinix sp.]